MVTTAKNTISNNNNKKKEQKKKMVVCKIYTQNIKAKTHLQAGVK